MDNYAESTMQHLSQNIFNIFAKFIVITKLKHANINFQFRLTRSRPILETHDVLEECSRAVPAQREMREENKKT